MREGILPPDQDAKELDLVAAGQLNLVVDEAYVH